MPKSAALTDELDIDQFANAIAADAAPALATALHSAGPRYPWEEIVPDMVRRLIECLWTAGEPSSPDKRRVAAAARRCARDWVPLQEIELCCQIVLVSLFRNLWNTVRPRAASDLLRASSMAASGLPVILTVIRRAYIEETIRVGGGQAAAQLVVATLSGGGDVASVASEAGVSLPDNGVIAALVPVPADDKTEPPLFDEVPPGIRAQLPAGALCAPTPERTRLLALLPAPDSCDPETEPAVRIAATRLLGACHATYGWGFVAGLAGLTGGETAETRAVEAKAATEEAIATSALLAGLGEAGRAAFLSDTVVGAALVTRRDLRLRLAARMAAVREREQLWTTLLALYRCDLDRGRTARLLGIHRSTLDYRLNRIEQLAGCSPTSVRGIQLFSAGLAADALGP
ncbi:helix-turn-helix domain-containing protein [Actinomadura barringtoniae]|uniref:Helix-turn-helix domain-containing protein n=1 Tax=Actinomadura barringtoniae TaxID=1427535 RepID=A0A939TB41_9ACTN|nr:helix-turn-helix domain-containing protein [Actinomadura barringtoniae]MBO2449755.1 helix-turn-helix domain-containing protein [Actinomadura barringtoniae]